MATVVFARCVVAWIWPSTMPSEFPTNESTVMPLMVSDCTARVWLTAVTASLSPGSPTLLVPGKALSNADALSGSRRARASGPHASGESTGVSGPAAAAGPVDPTAETDAIAETAATGEAGASDGGSGSCTDEVSGTLERDGAVNFGLAEGPELLPAR